MLGLALLILSSAIAVPVDSQPALSASPKEIQVGLTRDFSVRCSFADLAANNVSQIASLGLFHMKSNVSELLASVTLFSPAQKIQHGQDDIVVSGSVNGPEAYLEIGWEHPGHSHAGQYTCDILALDLTCTFVHFSRTINVTAVDSTRDELEARILNLETDLSNVEIHLSHLNSSCQNTTQDLVNTSQELTQTSQQLVNVSQELMSARLEIAILKYPGSCEQAKRLTSGHQIVQLNLDNQPADHINVICELNSDGQVWTVFQRRYDYRLDFNRSYAEYENGFGSLQGEFWLGLKNMVRLMGSRPCELHVDMLLFLNNRNYTRIYTTFALDPVDYTLTVGGYDDGGYGLSYQSGQAFYTYDRDSRPRTCATEFGGGWWYKQCFRVNLNGGPFMSWYELVNNTYALSSSEMKFRCETQ